MNEPAVWVALLVAVVGPCLLAWLNGRQRRKEAAATAVERAAEAQRGYDREDAVAAKAEEAARLLAAQNRRVAATAAVTLGTLRVIHTLVNSQMTAVMTSELHEARDAVMAMNEVVDLIRAAGREPSAEKLAQIEDKRAKIVELEAALADRLTSAALVDAQTAELEAIEADTSEA